MEKLEKVIAGWEWCSDVSIDSHGCTGCPYDGSGCRDTLISDALELLKELDGKYRAAVEAAAIATEIAAKKEKSLNQAWEKMDRLALELAQAEEALSDLRKAASADDLISRSALLTEIEENPWSIDIDELAAVLEQVPTVEAEPVANESLRHFLELEVAQTAERQKLRYNPVYDGEYVGYDEARRLRERHYLFCKHLLSMCCEGAHMDEEVTDEN